MASALLSALVLLRRFVVNEIIVAFLGPLPLPRHPKSKPITPRLELPPYGGYHQGTRPMAAHPASDPLE